MFVMFSLSFFMILHIWPHRKQADSCRPQSAMFDTSSELGPLPDQMDKSESQKEAEEDKNRLFRDITDVSVTAL